jgi:casein kinase I family protein HRR25
MSGKVQAGPAIFVPGEESVPGFLTGDYSMTAGSCKIFRDLFVRESFQYDYVSDRTVYKYQKNAQAIAQATGNAQNPQEEDDKNARRRLITNTAAAGGPAAQPKPAAIGTRRKLLERGTFKSPDTNRAVGGTDRL